MNCQCQKLAGESMENESMLISELRETRKIHNWIKAGVFIGGLALVFTAYQSIKHEKIEYD